MLDRSTSTRRGFTLVECLLAAVIVAIVCLGLASMLAATYQNEAASVDTAEAVQVGRELVEQIAALPPGSGTATPALPRATCRDYHGYADTVTTPAGAFTRTASVEYRRQPNGAADTSGKLAVVTVTVVTPDGRQVPLVRLVTAKTLD